MKKQLFLALGISASLLASCGQKDSGNRPDGARKESTEIQKPATEETPGSSDRYFGVEAAYIKYKSQAAGQELTREWWFDHYGKRQSEENYMILMGQKTGGKSVIMDGYRYEWDYDAVTGTKRSFYQPVTDYENVSRKDIERYGIEKHGYEEILGKNCLKVTVEKPAKSTVWIWEGIPLKTEAVFAGQKVISEAVEIVTGEVDKKVFGLPSGVNFTEPN